MCVLGAEKGEVAPIRSLDFLVLHRRHLMKRQTQRVFVKGKGFFEATDDDADVMNFFEHRCFARIQLLALSPQLSARVWTRGFKSLVCFADC